MILTQIKRSRDCPVSLIITVSYRPHRRVGLVSSQRSVPSCRHSGPSVGRWSSWADCCPGPESPPHTSRRPADLQDNNMLIIYSGNKSVLSDIGKSFGIVQILIQSSTWKILRDHISEGFSESGFVVCSIVGHFTRLFFVQNLSLLHYTL